VGLAHKAQVAPMLFDGEFPKRPDTSIRSGPDGCLVDADRNGRKIEHILTRGFKLTCFFLSNRSFVYTYLFYYSYCKY
jgi:hypothetical protein